MAGYYEGDFYPVCSSNGNNGFGGYNRAPMPPAQPMQPATPRYAQPVSPFEPDDPIPEAEPDRKHRPRFVDFFMRKNNEDNE